MRMLSQILSMIALAVCVTLTTAWRQQASSQKTSPAELLSKLGSDEPIVRNDALEQLRSNPDALRDPKIKTALVNLLDQENHRRFSEDDEGYADYVAGLAEITAKVVDWTDQRQVCILADGVYLERELADHARASLPCLLSRFNNGPNALRGRVVTMIVQTLAKGRNELDTSTIQSTQETILRALHDTDEHVRANTVRALGKFGGPEMIPALTRLQGRIKLSTNWTKAYGLGNMPSKPSQKFRREQAKRINEQRGIGAFRVSLHSYSPISV
jgi:HEAT repeats